MAERLIYNAPQRVADWIASVRGDEAPSVDAAIGYEKDGELRAGVYFDGFTGNNIFVHTSSTISPFPRRLIYATYYYAFVENDLERLTFSFLSTNLQTLLFVTGMGAQREAVLTRAGPNCDVLVYVLWHDAPFVRKILSRGYNG